MESLNNYEKLKANGGLRKLGFASVVALCLTVIGFFCYAFSHPFSQNQVAEITETWTYYPKNSPDSTFKSRYVKHLPQNPPQSNHGDGTENEDRSGKPDVTHSRQSPMD